MWLIAPGFRRPCAPAAQQGPLVLPPPQEGRAQAQVGARLHRGLDPLGHLAGADEEGRAGVYTCVRSLLMLVVTVLYSFDIVLCVFLMYDYWVADWVAAMFYRVWADGLT